jgi:hypothetical protein
MMTMIYSEIEGLSPLINFINRQDKFATGFDTTFVSTCSNSASNSHSPTEFPRWPRLASSQDLGIHL